MSTQVPRIPDTNIPPPSKWWVVDPDTNYQVGSNSYRNLKAQWAAHRKGNDLNHEPKWIEDAIHAQICERDPDYCTGPKPFKQTNGQPSGDPSLLEMGLGFTRETLKWIRGGAKLATKEQIESRRAICDKCPHWLPNARMGMGKCKKCGCSALKFVYDTSRCPIGKW